MSDWFLNLIKYNSLFIYLIWLKTNMKTYQLLALTMPYALAVKLQNQSEM